MRFAACRCVFILSAVLWIAAALWMDGVVGAEPAGAPTVASDAAVRSALEKIGVQRGLVALAAISSAEAAFPVKLAQASDLLIYVQAADAEAAASIRQAAADAGLLGIRLFIHEGGSRRMHLADNLADCVLVGAAAATDDAELLRVLRPRGTAYRGEQRVVKPVPAGADAWSHPYHGPDNNPQSRDQLVRGALRTQFLGYPMFSPMPEQSVAAGGRIFKAMGHIAHKANQNEMLNTLLCINAYNGEILWRRTLPLGFMIHRNTMIATEDALYLGDDVSCKVLDAATGAVRDQLTVPAEITDGPVWKWMALQDGILYGLVGSTEIQVETQASNRRGLGHWPWGMWQGHDYSDPAKAFGYGRTFVAIDPRSKQVLWHYRDDQYLDARGVCMNRQHLFFYAPNRFLGALHVSDGSLAWKNAEPAVLEAIAPNAPAQHYTTGYSTTCYMKCNDDLLFFAGPQRGKLVAAAASNGKLAWSFPVGNLQLVLRDDAVYAAGPQGSVGAKLEYATGRVLAEFAGRRACTRATGCADSIFFRANGGTVRLMTDTNRIEHIAPMRPPCQDGVLIAEGHLYWGPWMCGCQLSLYGNVGLGPLPAASEVAGRARPDEALAREPQAAPIEPLPIDARDWPAYRGNNARSDVALDRKLPSQVQLAWSQPVARNHLPTAPVAAGGLIFVADRSGAVQALDAAGRMVWRAFTGGPVYYSPAVARDRVFVGSADGRVYAFAARGGQRLWSHRLATEDRLIPVFGKLVATWPLAGGVAVENGVVYAAAGFTHYDGTYVAGFDAVSGERVAENATSGVVAAEVNNGISMQGEVAIAEGELRFLGGGVYETARYELATLRCLNQPKVQIVSDFRTAFYPYYPDYGKYLSLDFTCADGNILTHDASYEGSQFTNLMLHEPLPAGVERPFQEAARWIRRRGGTPPKVIWQDQADQRFTSFVVTDGQLLAAGHPDAKPDEPFLAAINIQNGADLWRQKLPANVVKGGLAIDRDGRILAALEDGQLQCWTAAP